MSEKANKWLNKRRHYWGMAKARVMQAYADEQNKALIELVKELLNASNTDKWVDVYNKARITLKQIRK